MATTKANQQKAAAAKAAAAKAAASTVKPDKRTMLNNVTKALNKRAVKS